MSKQEPIIIIGLILLLLFGICILLLAIYLCSSYCINKYTEHNTITFKKKDIIISPLMIPV